MGVQINGSEGNVVATKGTYSGNVTIGGTLTYEDVTNIDSVGLVTARTGIEIGARPGVAASISVDGNMIVSGITTFTPGGSEIVRINSGGLLAYNDVSFFGASYNAYWDKSANQFLLNDNTKLSVGSSSDLKIYHTGSQSRIENSGTGVLRIQADDIQIVDKEANDFHIKCVHDGAVELYNDNTKRFQTTGNGADVFGNGTTNNVFKLINTSATGNASHHMTLNTYNASGYWSDLKIDASNIQLNTYTGNRATLSNTALTFASGVNIAMANNNGIDFSASVSGLSTTSSLFDDYEEGTYTPVVKTTSSGTVMTYGYQSNDYEFRSGGGGGADPFINYTKIGNRVFLAFSIMFNSSGSTRFNISLPFARAGNDYGVVSCPAFYSISGAQTLGTLGSGAGSFDTFNITSGGSHGNINYTSSSEVYYNFQYTTAS